VILLFFSYLRDFEAASKWLKTTTPIEKKQLSAKRRAGPWPAADALVGFRLHYS
jgi:hypothetical protein